VTPTTATAVAAVPTRINGFEVGLEPDLEQQHHYPDLCEQLNTGVSGSSAPMGITLSKAGAERDARQELAHHGRLAQALERLAGDFPASSIDREPP